MFSLAPEGKGYIFGTLFLSTVVSFFYPWISLLCWISFFSLIYFFRDPERKVPQEEGLIISPADGKVIDISEAFENKFLKDRSIKISIFMSLLDVHVNRSPIDGEVVFRDYVRGAKRMAFGSKASASNERSYVGIRGEIPILLVQVAGFLARRIVTYPKVGDFLKRGDRFGIIKLGSRVEVFLPTNVDIKVKVGSRVKAGETVLGVIRRNEDEKGEVAELSNER